MSDHQGQLRLAQVAVDHVQVGAADAAGANGDQDLAGPGLRLADLRSRQRPALLLEHHGAHSPIIARGARERGRADARRLTRPPAAQGFAPNPTEGSAT